LRGILKVIAADSSTAILDQKFKAQSIVAAAAVLVSPPYRGPKTCLAEPIFADAKKGHEVVVHEAELCKELLGKAQADIIHLDISLGATPIERLSPIQLSNIRISSRARRHLIEILPKLRKIAGEVTQRYGTEMLAIGKESVPVRIAELTAGAHAILYTCKKAVEEDQEVILGLPSKCQPKKAGNIMYLQSLIPAEHDIQGYANDETEILKKVKITEMLNPVARGFRTLKIMPKEKD
jgi:hypothetical protein